MHLQAFSVVITASPSSPLPLFITGLGQDASGSSSPLADGPGLRESSSSSPETEPASNVVMRHSLHFNWVEDDVIEEESPFRVTELRTLWGQALEYQHHHPLHPSGQPPPTLAV